MKLKYYLRGLGIGIIVTTIILMICFALQKDEISDEEVMRRAAALGMVMPETETLDDTEAETPDDAKTEASETEDAVNAADQPETEKNNNQSNDGAAALGDSQANGSEQKEDDANVDSQSAEVMAHQGENYRLQVERGDVCRTICEKLAQNGIIEDSELFRQYLSQIGYASQISTGTYEIPYGLTMEEVAVVLQSGPLEKQ